MNQEPKLLSRHYAKHIAYSLLTREKDVANFGSDTSNMTALHLAIYHDRSSDDILHIIDMMDDKDIDACWGAGNTALHLAASKNLKPIVEELLARGAAFDVRTHCPLSFVLTWPAMPGGE